MSRKRRPPAEAPPAEPPPMPEHLSVYDAADWLPDGAPVDAPTDNHDVAGWMDWEQAHRDAYRRHIEAREAWHREHGYGSPSVAAVVPDEPFDAGDLVFDGHRVSRDELRQIGDDIRTGARPRP